MNRENALVQPGYNISSAALSCLETAAQICLALKGMESMLCDALGDGQWSWDFPAKQIEILASDIETAMAGN